MPAGSGSVIVVVATDAPLLPNQCKALARRVTLGLARTGTTGSHFSGDLFLAFSTASPGGITPGVTTFRPGAEGRYDQLRSIAWGYLDPFYAAVVHSTQEAVLNALIANEDMTGRAGDRTPALPRDRIAKLLSTRHGQVLGRSRKASRVISKSHHKTLRSPHWEIDRPATMTTYS